MTIVDGRIGWVGGAGSRTTSVTVGSTTCSCASPIRKKIKRLALVAFVASFPLAGRQIPGRHRALFTSLDTQPTLCTAVVFHNAPQLPGPIKAAIERS